MSPPGPKAAAACSSLAKAALISIYAVFLIITLVQLGMLVWAALTTTELYTTMERRPTAGKPLPISLSACIRPRYSKEALADAGYPAGADGFYFGLSEAHPMGVGWAGYAEGGGQAFQDSAALLEQVKLYQNVSDVLGGLMLLKNGLWEHIDNREKINDLVKNEKHYLNYYCYNFKPDLLDKTAAVEFLFNPNVTLDVEILIWDTNLQTERTIPDHKTNYQGDRVKTSYERHANKTKSFDFIIEMRQEVFVEEDETKNCSVYPTGEHASYGECDRRYILAQLATLFGPSFVPLWAADNATLVTAAAQFPGPGPWPGPEAYTPYYNLGLGIQLSDCRLPCTTTRTYSQQIGERDGHYGMHGILVNFAKDMQVTSTSLVSFSIVDFFSDMGGILGLWLGLGAVQMGELGVQALARFQARA
jgi:hypothetical protein